MTQAIKGTAQKLKVKTILISQPEPEQIRNPYAVLAEKHKLKIDFRPFIHVEGIPGREFRKARIQPTDCKSIIFTSRNSIDHFFRICEEFRVKMRQDTRFFCISEAIALYLQKYTQYRKRKVFYADGSVQAFCELLQKYKNDDLYLYPCSDIRKNDLPEFLTNEQFNFREGVIYKTVASDLSDLKDLKYDMIVFFSPAGVKSLYQNFPKFEQHSTKIAAFGPTTSKAVEEAGLSLDVTAPIPQAPSMAMAIEKYLAANK